MAGWRKREWVRPRGSDPFYQPPRYFFPASFAGGAAAGVAPAAAASPPSAAASFFTFFFRTILVTRVLGRPNGLRPSANDPLSIILAIRSARVITHRTRVI